MLYTPLHWLAYWNDYYSVQYLLDLVDKEDYEEIELIMSKTSEGVTPMDIAGRNKSNQTAIMMLEYFRKNFDIIVDVF